MQLILKLGYLYDKVRLVIGRFVLYTSGDNVKRLYGLYFCAEDVCGWSTALVLDCATGVCHFRCEHQYKK